MRYFPLCAARLGLPIASWLALALLAGCSSPASSPSAAPGAAPGPAAAGKLAPRPARSFGTAVDSLNGVPGHAFGTPLSALSGLKQGESAAQLSSYYYPTGAAQDKSWFAKHRTEVPGVFYCFKEGQFVQFQAIAYSPEGQAALAQEARFLFGPGRQLGDRTEWDGTKAWAVCYERFVNGKIVQVLDVNSHPLLDGPSTREQARLQAENAQ